MLGINFKGTELLEARRKRNAENQPWEAIALYHLWHMRKNNWSSEGSLFPLVMCVCVVLFHYTGKKTEAQ